MSCSHVSSCELYPQFAFNSALKIWQLHYCEGDYARCARYQLALSGQSIPLNLLPNGQEVEAPRSSAEYGATALFNAILKRRVPMVLSLLRAGVNVNAQNSEGTTPLMAAASARNLEIFRLLLAHGADPSVTDGLGETAYDIAVRTGFREAIELLGQASSRAKGAGRTERSGFWRRLFS